MRNAMIVIAFLLGAVVSGLLVYFTQATAVRSISEEKAELEARFEKLEEEFKPFKSGWEPFDKKLQEALKREETLADKLNVKEIELQKLRAENEKIKTAARRRIEEDKPEQVAKTVEAGEQAENSSRQDSAKKVKTLKDLIARLERTPADRKLMQEILEKIWQLEDPEAVKELVEKLKGIVDGALENEPENLDLIFNQGNAYGAELAYLQAKMQENPMVYGPRMGEVAIKAIECFSKVVQKDPKDNEALLTRALWCYHNPGSTDQAQKDFTELVKRAKEQGFEQETGEQVFAGMAMTYQKLDRQEEAKKVAEEGLSLYPQSERLRKLLEQLR
jgi:tetratricopeptide (TPR) repeat protein